jgi:soluble lytic murein transglycosylase-like protein
MKVPQPLAPVRSLKFIGFTLIALFVFANFTGAFFIDAFAPIVAASEQDEPIPADIPTSGDQRLDRIIFRIGKQQGVDPRFIHAVIWQESKYDQRAKSHAGAQGLMQLMPATAKRFGCNHTDDPEDNILAGTKYLSWLLKRFDGNVSLALAGYNAGEGAVDKYNGIPPYGETQNYVRIITDRYGKVFHPVLSPDDASRAFHLDAAASDVTWIQ